MATLSRELRKTLENTIAAARTIAEAGAEQALKQLAVHHHESWPGMKPEEKQLREKLRAHGKQLGDKREANRAQEITRLKQACAYEHWHRMLFARFLAENDLLLDPDYGVALSLDEVKERARELNEDWLALGAGFAQRMLLEVFRPDDPVLEVSLPPETRQKLEVKLTSLPAEIFRADDSLGWVYQFWQSDEKDRVNKSEIKIGADEVPPVTQLFTEDYMVLFLLENTLGAWWTAKRRPEGKDPALAGYTWTYLRLDEDGSPAAGSFDGWPHTARELRVLDPCMGSGHFLVFALPILARMRTEEEGLSLKEALAAVLRDNLFGLEIDARCSQIAAFNLALAAWRLAGEHFPLPQMNLACSGLGIHASEADWVNLSGGDFVADQWMRRLYSLFRDAPTLGSLIDPMRYLARGQEAGLEKVLPLIDEALQREQSEEKRELAIAAQGVVAAFRVLVDRFTLVATNVPYLGRGRQHDTLRQHCEDVYSEAAADVAACFVDRCRDLCAPNCTTAIVTKQEPLSLKQYKGQRQRLLKIMQWNFVARLGPRAFETITGERVNVALLALTNRSPSPTDSFLGWDVGELKTPRQKAAALAAGRWINTNQEQQLKNPDSRIVLEVVKNTSLLGEFASALAGHAVGDSVRFERAFWEVDQVGDHWEFLQSTVEATALYGGRSGIIFWEKQQGQMYALAQSVRHLNHIAQNWLRGKPSWGKRGVVVSQMGSLPATIYLGQIYDCNCCAVIPNRDEDLGALWAYCSSKEFLRNVRQLDQKMNVAPHTLLKVYFDSAYWNLVAHEQYPAGLPLPYSDDPTQWLFNGIPKGSDQPLQVAVARLVGYRWPRQSGSNFPECPPLEPDNLESHADADGIVTLSSLAGEATAADRLRALLTDTYSAEWSAAKLTELLSDSESLEVWLRDKFFEEHCQIFHQRPFVWHIWDGRKDGFHALVNYHKLAGPNGEGRQTLERLIYTSLGDWIGRQRDEVRDGKEGADSRLTAALHLKGELEKIRDGEEPYDIFVRWKPLHKQPIGWEPDLNDGVRLNVRPWLTAKPYQPSRRDASILRVTPNLKYGKDRGKEPTHDKTDFPWFAATTDRNNDIHLSLEEKSKVRERRKN